MAAVKNPDGRQPVAHVACDFPGVATIPRYQTHKQFAEHWIAGLWCKIEPDAGCADVLSQGRAVIQRGKHMQTTNY
jgi:hypothetical protein